MSDNNVEKWREEFEKYHDHLDLHKTAGSYTGSYNCSNVQFRWISFYQGRKAAQAEIDNTNYCMNVLLADDKKEIESLKKENEELRLINKDYTDYGAFLIHLKEKEELKQLVAESMPYMKENQVQFIYRHDPFIWEWIKRAEKWVGR